MKEDDVVQFAKALVDVKENYIVAYVVTLLKMIHVIFVKISKEIVQLFVLWKMTKMLSQWKNERV